MNFEYFSFYCSIFAVSATPVVFWLIFVGVYSILQPPGGLVALPLAVVN